MEKVFIMFFKPFKLFGNKAGSAEETPYEDDGRKDNDPEDPNESRKDNNPEDPNGSRKDNGPEDPDESRKDNGPEDPDESRNDNGPEDPDELVPVKNTRRTKMLSILLLIVLLAVISYILFSHTLTVGSSYNTAVRINEIMSYSSSCPNADGMFCDYIELYNDSDADMDISGFRLKSSSAYSGFVFGNDTVIPARGYLVVSCGGRKSVKGDRSLYAPFAISSAGGEQIMLTDPLGQTIDKVFTAGLEKNGAMIRLGNGGWDTFSAGTPGFENSDFGRAAYMDSIRTEEGLVISELMAKNISGIAAKDGGRYDWIEITNTSDTRIDLKGRRISDDPSQLSGYVLPSVELGPGECAVLFASKLSKNEDGEIHTDFALSNDGETLFLTSPEGRLESAVEYPALKDNYSYMLKDGEYVISAFSSPGSPDTEPSENAFEGLKISELMPANREGYIDIGGSFADWIELSNDSSEDISLSGCWLSADPSDPFGWQIPDVTIETGECLVICAYGDDAEEADGLRADFKLPSDSGSVSLVSPAGLVIDSAAYTSSQPGRSLVRKQGGFESTAHPTPGFPNGSDGFIAYQQSLAVSSPLQISEAMTANDSVLRQAFGRYFDWVEIKNAGETPLRLSDYYLSDDYDSKTMWRMPDITLAPGSYKVFMCSGDEKLSGKYAHTNFSLNSETETLFIFDNDGKACDRILLCDIPANVSAGRMDGQNGFFLFLRPTPNNKNTGGVRAVSAAPYSTAAAGEYNAASLTIPLFSDGDIYYTTDGSAPDQASKKYTNPITITKSTVIRAVSYSAGSLKSNVTTLSFFLNEGNTLPIMSLSADPSDLWSAKNGIYQAEKAFRNWEKDAHLEFFDPNGKGFSIDCGLSLFGGGTRVVSAKKSFQVRFRSVYGEKSLVYDMFEGSDVNEFKSLVLRAGQDTKHTIIRDEIFPSFALEESPTLLAQNFRYCLLFINGKFFGIYCLKERLGDDYYASHFNVPIESVEVVKGPVKRDTGIYALMSFASTHDMKDEENYAYIESKIDLDSLIDWYIFEACSGNNDITGNVRYIRSSEGDGKWRFALFDTEFALRWPINDFEWVYGSGKQHAKLLRGLIKNPEFKDRFLSRFGYLLNNVFTEEKLQARIDKLSGQLLGDIVRERKKWHSGYKTYGEGLQRMYNVLHRYDYKGRIVKSVSKALRLSAEERKKYFGA